MEFSTAHHLCSNSKAGLSAQGGRKLTSSLWSQILLAHTAFSPHWKSHIPTHTVSTHREQLCPQAGPTTSLAENNSTPILHTPNYTKRYQPYGSHPWQGTEPSFSFLILLKLVKKINNNNKKIKKLLKPAYIPDINNTLFCRFAENPYSISKLKDRPYTAIMAAGVTLSIRKSVYSPAKHGWISWRLQCVALQDTVTQSIWFQTIRGLGKVLKAYFFKPD